MQSVGFYHLLIIIILPVCVVLVKSFVKYYKKLGAHSVPTQKEAGSFMTTKDESTFLLATFQEVVTKLKEKEKELKQGHETERERADKTELFSEKILSSIESALITIDKSGHITTFNSAAERLFKMSADAAKTSVYERLFSSSPQMIELIRNCLLSNRSYKRQEIKMVNSGGETLHLGVAVSPIKDGRGRSTGALCLISDLTEMIELQARMKLKESLASLGEMSAGIAHEFKNSLATILGHAQIALRETQDPSIRENVLAIADEARSLLQVVANFLDFAKPNTLHVEEIDLGELIKECLKSLENVNNFSRIRIYMGDFFPTVRGDRVLLKQALMNLLRNAIEAIAVDNPERNIGIRGSVEKISHIENAAIEIEDTGVGIPDSELEKIFLPFYTTKPQGTGLGLAIAQKIIVYHNGKITARRKTDQGMIFTISIPISPKLN